MHATTAASGDPARPPHPSGPTRPFINRDFALLWGGQTISNLGDWLFNTTLVLWIATGLGHGQPWAPLAVSGVLVARFVPTILVGPLAGVFVDRWDKRRALLWADALRALLLLLLAPVAGLASLSVAWRLAAVYAVVVLATVCGQFFDPARLALVGDIVEEPARPRASSLEQVTGSLALVAGPALAAPLYVGLGARWAILADALSFAASFLLVLRMRAPRLSPQGNGETDGAAVERGGLGGEFVAGLRLVAGHRVLRTIAVSGVLALLGFGCVNALDIFFATGTLHASTALYGLLDGALGLGLLGGAVLGGLLATRLGLTRVLWLSLVALGLLIMVYARLTLFGPALGVLFLLGIPNGTLNVVIGPLLLQATPRAFVGRVEAALMSLLSLASLASIIVAGLLDGTLLRGFHARVLGLAVGPIDTIFTGAGLLALAGGLYAARNLRYTSTLQQTEDEAA